ncbi:hypothetical protein PGT21_007166 [Puccinia graminis f. sp. tritici]|uniref:Uncharacterized protein n=1 Tax=Puccinia graminis f. sp. tritici TaxID=56615 RepID=A0A5B0N5K4_PUCGR|nr:hypothetical protein PGT21_007166 [Puccinia graminis f. sp. tritici]
MNLSVCFWNRPAGLIRVREIAARRSARVALHSRARSRLYIFHLFELFDLSTNNSKGFESLHLQGIALPSHRRPAGAGGTSGDRAGRKTGTMDPSIESLEQNDRWTDWCKSIFCLPRRDNR